MQGHIVDDIEHLLILDDLNKCEKSLNALLAIHRVLPKISCLGVTSSLSYEIERVCSPKVMSQFTPYLLYPLNFEEFLTARKKECLISWIDDARDTKKKDIHGVARLADTEMRNYLIVGGFPKTIKIFNENQGINNFELERASALAIFDKYNEEARLGLDEFKNSSVILSNYFRIMMENLNKQGCVFTERRVYRNRKSTYLNTFTSLATYLEALGMVVNSKIVDVTQGFHPSLDIYHTYFIDPTFYNIVNSLTPLDVNLLPMKEKKGKIMMENYLGSEIVKNYFPLLAFKKENLYVPFVFKNQSVLGLVEQKAHTQYHSAGMKAIMKACEHVSCFLFADEPACHHKDVLLGPYYTFPSFLRSFRYDAIASWPASLHRAR
jgi:predicted AAA+ superfamily ATPase